MIVVHLIGVRYIPVLYAVAFVALIYDIFGSNHRTPATGLIQFDSIRVYV